MDGPLDPFEGFRLATFRFFEELEANNNRMWFEAHKAVYETVVLQPTREFAVAMRDYFRFKDPEMNMLLRRIISRITRDTRSNPTQPPYKTCQSLNFRRAVSGDARDWSSYPEFFIHINKDGADYGLGLHTVRQKTQELIRQEIINEQDDFKRILKGLVNVRGFELNGKPLKYPVPTEEKIDESLLPWLQHENIYLTKHLAISHIIISEDLVTYLRQEFDYLYPLYQFFMRACH
ncbi:hypothetical protein AGMMS50262_06700 [Bacteroidia bacterium]|nr:hypothetical protein AGMMS50262_06700 [Bacteroidia bacterium]